MYDPELQKAIWVSLFALLTLFLVKKKMGSYKIEGYRVAEPFLRFTAILPEFFVYVLLTILLIVPLYLITGYVLWLIFEYDVNAALGNLNKGEALLIFIAIGNLLTFLIISYSDIRGKTIGKKLQKLEVIDKNGGKLSISKTIARNFLASLNLYFFFYFFILTTHPEKYFWLVIPVLVSIIDVGFSILNSTGQKLSDTLLEVYVINVGHPTIPITFKQEKKSGE